MKSIAVYCGSSEGCKSIYMQKAKELGITLASRQITLIYGGAKVGLMGAVADGAIEAGGKVVGVIPTFLKELEIEHPQLSELIEVHTMHERKAKMVDLADGFITLPGGSGTMEEFFEVLTMAQLNQHQKPCALYNIDAYYTPLLSFFDHMNEQGFIRSEHRDLIMVNDEPETLLEMMKKRFDEPHSYVKKL